MAMDRRTFLTITTATIASPVVSGVAMPRPHEDAADVPRKVGKRPKNIIVMICDDLGSGDLGCYGAHVPTPNLDKLAAGGMRFTHFNAGHPVCSASRAALLTGRYAPRSHTQVAYLPNSKTGMALDEVTLANLFQKKDYRTKAIGKWHLGDAPEYLPTRRGFDSFYGVAVSVDMQPLPMYRDESPLDTDTDRDLLTVRYTEEAVGFLEEGSDKPFFLYVAYSYPHDPARASLKFRDRTKFGIYGDSVHEIDWSVGEIRRALEKKGLLSDTLILFTSDHGPWWQGSVGNLRGRKMSSFEGGFRVPLIAHWPSAIPAGVVSKAWASNLDLLPTLTALCGLNGSPNPLDGIDISSLLFGGQENANRKSVLYFVGDVLNCARKGDWKLRVAQRTGEIYIEDLSSWGPTFWLARPELYNLASDPGESYDVAEQHPEIVKEILDDIEAQMPTFPEDVVRSFTELRQKVASLRTPPGSAPLPPNSPVSEWNWDPPDRRDHSEPSTPLIGPG